MKITLINGSPKRRDSASGVILSQLKGYMKNDASLCELHFFTPHPQPEQLQAAADSDVLILPSPCTWTESPHIWSAPCWIWRR